jgi:plastocyanin
MGFDNLGDAPHNFFLYQGTSPDGPLVSGCTSGCLDGEVSTDNVAAGESIELTFTTPGPGTYAFECTLHSQMTGTLIVEEGAPLPGGGGGGGGDGDGGGGAPGATTITADNLAFGTTEFTVAAGSETSVTLDNQDAAPHNLVFFQSSTPGGDPLTGCTAGCEGDEVRTPPLVPSGGSATLTFTAPSDPGDYAYQCQLHPEMVGVMHVE